MRIRNTQYSIFINLNNRNKRRHMSRPRAPNPTASTASRALQMEIKERAKKARNLADFIKELIGEHIIISSKNGVIYEGTLIGKDHGFLILADATVRGAKYTAKVGFLLIKQDIIQHIHGPPKELAENKAQQP